MTRLTRYWFNFEMSGQPTPLNLGCGVTAHNHDDAIHLLRTRVFRGGAVPAIVGCAESVDVSSLDAKHVLPNVGFVEARGIWFPQGYDE